jgi:hypothetical protein
MLPPSSGTNKPSKIPLWKQVLKMEAVCSTETVVDFHWTAWYYFPEDSTLDTAFCATVMIASMLTMEDIHNHLAKYVTVVEG